MQKATLDFLDDLRANNYRDWFWANRPRYEAARADVVAFVGEMLPRVRELDPSVGDPDPKQCLFRIARDTRFSSNKEPYKTHFGATFGDRRAPYPCYYVEIAPGASFVAAGVYMPAPAVLKALREAVDEEWEEFRSIIEDPEFVRVTGGLKPYGEPLKRVPAGFDKASPAAEYLKYREYGVDAPLSDETVLSPGFGDELMRLFRVFKPLNDFLYRPLRGLPG